MLPISFVRFTRNCDKMYSRHIFPYGVFDPVSNKCVLIHVKKQRLTYNINFNNKQLNIKKNTSRRVRLLQAIICTVFYSRAMEKFFKNCLFYYFISIGRIRHRMR